MTTILQTNLSISIPLPFGSFSDFSKIRDGDNVLRESLWAGRGPFFLNGLI